MEASSPVSEHIIRFLKNLKPYFQLPDGVSILHPFVQQERMMIAEKFYRKFYADSLQRKYLIGINPGRFGGGITGIPFTDPLQLQERCGIANPFQKKTELSAVFIYTMIQAYGGVDHFYRSFYFTAVCPLGFVKNEKNMNYYDDPVLLKNAESFIVSCFREQLAKIPASSIAYCLGEGTNFKHLSRLNEQYSFFEKIIPLPHPRWIMQYRRKEIEKYVSLYCEVLSA